MTDQLALDPTLAQLLNEIIRAHGRIQQLQARVAELEQQLHPPNGVARLPSEVVAGGVTS